MAYEDLRKLSFSHREQHKNIYLSRFASDSSIHLSISIHGHPAFFLITPDILHLVSSILRWDQNLNKLRQILPGNALNQYKNTCLINEIMLTNDIENVHSSRREIGDLLFDLSLNDKRKRFGGLVNKYKMLLNDDPRELSTCQDIRDIFDELVSSEILEDEPANMPDGKYFRADSVTVYSKTQKPLHHGLQPESNIIETLEQSLQFLNNDSIEYLLRISVFHYLFGYIHPFYDGNGRVSRFISSYLLSGVLDPLVSFHLSLTIKNQLSAYYKAFEICNDPRNMGDLTPFIIMFLGIIRDSIKELYADLKAKIDEWMYYLNIAENTFNLAEKNIQILLSLLIQAALFSERGIPTSDLLDILDVSRTTLTTYFKSIPRQLYKSKKLQNTKYYQADLKELEDFATDILPS